MVVINCRSLYLFNNSTLRVLQAPINPAVSHCVKAAPVAREADPVKAAAAAAAAAAKALDAAARRRSGGGVAAPAALKGQKAGTVLVVPDLEAVLGQMAALGEGLVAEVLVGKATLELEPRLAHAGVGKSD